MSNALLVVETGDDACLSNLVAQKELTMTLALLQVLTGDLGGQSTCSEFTKEICRKLE